MIFEYASDALIMTYRKRELGHNSWHMIAAWSVSGEIAHAQDQVSVKHDERRAWKAEEESELTVAPMTKPQQARTPFGNRISLIIFSSGPAGPQLTAPH